MPDQHPDGPPLQLFYSYSHKDERLRDKLGTSLALLQRQGWIKGWHDRAMPPGSEFDPTIADHLETADVILLLISPYFVASDYCYTKEMQRAVERHDAGTARVIPVILRPTDDGWKTGTPFGKLVAVPKDAKAVTDWSNRDKAWADVAGGIRRAVQELRAQRMQQLSLGLFPVPAPTVAAAAAALCWACPAPLPLEVVARVIGRPEHEIVGDPALAVTGRVVAATTPMPTGATPHNDGNMLAAALQEILDFIDTHKREPMGREQIDNAVALARLCADTAPGLVAGVFPQLDKLLKDLGRKRLVLEVAELSLEAVKKATRTEQVMRDEAQTRVCGLCWVYQRTGHFGAALDEADRSLRLGEAISWKRNTAFCHKCKGRLLRLQAESLARPGNEDERARLLQESVELLNKAIEEFSALHSAMHPEVGDCYSLRARTFLVSGRGDRAREDIAEAERRLPRGGKDYIDLAILRGDVERWAHNESGARAAYTEALELAEDDSAPLCEMRARAYIGRAASYAAEGAKNKARNDYSAAATIYHDLQEWEAAAEAEWRAQMLAPTISLSREEQARLEREPPTVRVEALLRQSLEEEGRGRGRRAALAQRRGGRRWEQQIIEARVEAARKSPPW